MDRTIFQLQQTVQEVLSRHPKTRSAFISLKTQCVGCYLARFCTLQEVAKAYELEPGLLLEQLSTAADEKDIQPRSKQ